MRRTCRSTVTATALAVLLALPLTACGGGLKEVSGTRDQVRHSVDHDRSCTKKSKKRKGSSSRCHTTSKDLWCVSLDDVNGKSGKDDAWYEVKRDVYSKAQAQPAGAKLKFKPVDDDCD